MRLMLVPSNTGPIWLNPEHIAAVVPTSEDACAIYSVGVPTFTIARIPAKEVVDEAVWTPGTMRIPEAKTSG